MVTCSVHFIASCKPNHHMHSGAAVQQLQKGGGACSPYDLYLAVVPACRSSWQAYQCPSSIEQRLARPHYLQYPPTLAENSVENP